VLIFSIVYRTYVALNFYFRFNFYGDCYWITNLSQHETVTAFEKKTIPAFIAYFAFLNMDHQRMLDVPVSNHRRGKVCTSKKNFGNESGSGETVNFTTAS